MSDSQEKIKFEIHITVNSHPNIEANTFTEICSELNGKPLLIELAKGESPRQLMISKCISKNNLEEIFELCKSDCKILSVKGFATNRLKIEVNSNVAYLFEKDIKQNYFEWHGKLELKSYESLLGICRKHNAHLSRNSLKGENSYRFITLREFGEKNVFENRVFLLTEDLQNHDWEILKQESEFCVFDSNMFLDNGWLEN